MNRELLKQLVYLLYLGKGYPEYVATEDAKREYEARISKQIDNALDYVFYESPSQEEVMSLFPGLSFDNAELTEELLDAGLDNIIRCSRYSWVRGTTTPEFRKLLFATKARMFTSLHQHKKRITSEQIMKRTLEDGKFENFIRYDFELSDGTKLMTSLPWYDVKAYYHKKEAFKLMRHKEDFEPYILTEYDNAFDDASTVDIIRRGGAACIISFLVDALFPAVKIKKEKKVAKPKPQQKKQFTKKPYQQSQGQNQRRSYNNERRPYYNNENRSYNNERRPGTYQKAYSSEQSQTPHKKVVMRHRRPRIQTPPQQPALGEMPTIDTGITKL